MRVKVGNKVYSGWEEPVMVILTDQDKRNIASMDPGCTKYCMFPDEFQDSVSDWMRLPEDTALQMPTRPGP